MAWWKKIRRAISRNWRAVFSVFAVFMVIYAVWDFTYSFKQMEIDRKYEQIQEVTKENSVQIQGKFSDMIRQLQALADSVKGMEDIHEKVVLRKLRFSNELTLFDFVALADSQGNSIDSSEQEVNIAHRSYFEEAMKGNIAISEVMDSTMFAGEVVQIIAVPVWSEKEEVIGAAYGIFNINTISDLLQNAETEKGEPHVWILDSKGNYITRYDRGENPESGATLWEDFEVAYQDVANPDQIWYDFQNLKAGHFSFRFEGDDMVGYYMPLGINDWYVLSTTSEEPVTAYAATVNRLGIGMAARIAVACAIAAWCLLSYYRKMTQKLVDMHGEVADNEEILRLAIDQSGQIIFEYDIPSKTLELKAVNKDVLRLADSSQIALEELVSRKTISEDSAETFLGLFKQIETEAEASGDVKFLKEKEYRWYQIALKNIYKKDKIARTIGIIEDIHEQKIRELKLSERADRDGLTGLYNAQALKTRVAALLKEPEDAEDWHVFAILDLDNFKEVNDNLGHIMGDQVLADVSEIMRKKFRSSDILGRIGGDEFVIVLKHVPSRQVIDALFADLVRKMERTYEKDGVFVTVTASVGISLAPVHGNSFSELYEHADQALYQVKRARKNGYLVYEPDTF